MVKILGIISAVVMLVCAAVVTYSAPLTVTATGPPTESSAGVQIGVQVNGSAVLGTANHNTNVAAGHIELWFGDTALFTGADKTDEGLLKGPRMMAPMMAPMKVEPCAPSLILFDALTVINIMIEPASGTATGVDLLGAGKTDAAIFMGEEVAAPAEVMALIHSPPIINTIGFRGAFLA